MNISQKDDKDRNNEQIKGFAPVKKGRGPDKKPRKRGPEHGNYRHGRKNREYNFSKYRVWLDLVYRKFNFRCFLTNKTKKEAGALQCHHLDSWSGNEEKRYDINNAVL